jgi:hypothetical protein
MLRTTWACIITLALFVLSACLSVSALYGGLGIQKEDGGYILRQGRTRSEIDHTVGMLYYLATQVLLLLVPITVVSSILVFIKAHSIDPAKVLRGMPHANALRNAIRIALFSLVLPLLVVALKVSGAVP